ncbi:MAG: hypothetical protein AB1486_11970 [Planctomycetota bacterium]
MTAKLREPVSPVERMAMRRRRLILVVVLGVASLMAALMVWQPLHARSRLVDEQRVLRQELAALEATARSAGETRKKNAELLEAAHQDLAKLLPEQPDAELWRDILLEAAHRFGLARVTLLLDETLETETIETPDPGSDEDADVGEEGETGEVREPMAPVRALRFRMKAVGSLRAALVFLQSLSGMQPLVRVCRLSLRREEEPFDSVGLEITLACFWRELMADGTG